MVNNAEDPQFVKAGKYALEVQIESSQYSEWLGVIGWPHVAVLATAASAFWLWTSV